MAYLRSAPAQSWIKRQVKGATFLEITLTRLRELEILVPPLDLQSSFVELIDRVGQSRAEGAKSLAKLQEEAAALRHKSFSGALWDDSSVAFMSCGR